MTAPKSDNRIPRLQFDDGALPLPDKGEKYFIQNDNLLEQFNGEPEDISDGFWLFRAETGTSGIIPGKLKIHLNGRLIIGLSIIHHGNIIKTNGKEAKFLEIEERKADESSRLVGRQCKLCMVEITKGTVIIRCPYCGEGYHKDCWESLEGKTCCSRNCKFSPAAVDI
jgi:hypothetical protein